jgi:hypothetical protein
MRERIMSFKLWQERNELIQHLTKRLELQANLAGWDNILLTTTQLYDLSSFDLIHILNRTNNDIESYVRQGFKIKI